MLSQLVGPPLLKAALAASGECRVQGGSEAERAGDSARSAAGGGSHVGFEAETSEDEQQQLEVRPFSVSRKG